MRRLFISAALVATAALAVPVLLAPVAGAQTTTNLDAFCAKYIEIGNSEGKAQLALIEEVIPLAPANLVQPITEVRDAFKTLGGNKAYAKVSEQIATVDAFAYASCPGNAVALTAIDYEYQGMPATLPAGLNKFKLTNAAPKEAHEFGIAKLTAAGAAMDPQKLLALPEKKLGKFVDFEHASGTYAEPGTSGYTVADLDPGTYIYLCSLHVGGKKTGPLHFMKGMYGIVTVA